MKPGCCFFLILCFAPLGATAASCENGGTAVGEGCACPPGFNGTRCETGDSSKACQNGGTAVGTKCYCPPGFTGALCQDPDQATACQNGATAFGTECVCPPGYWGTTCQHKEQPSSCLNGGTLLGTGCHCPVGFCGPRCECECPDAPPTSTEKVVTREDAAASTSSTTLHPSPNVSNINSTVPTTAPTTERSPVNATEHVTRPPGNVSTSAVTAWPNRTSEATMAPGNPNTTCSGNHTSLGGTHNGTEVTQHPLNKTFPTTTASPTSETNRTLGVTQHPLNDTLTTTVTSPTSETNRTVGVTQHPLNDTLTTTVTSPTSETNRTMGVTQHPLNNTLPTTVTSPTSEPNRTVGVTQHPLNDTLTTTMTSPTSEPNRTVGVTQHPLNNTLPTTVTSPTSEPNRTMEVIQHPLNDTLTTTGTSPTSAPNRTMGMTQHPPNGTFSTTPARSTSEPSTAVNASLTTLKVPTSPPNTTTVPTSFSSTTNQSLSNFCYYFLHWYLNSSSPKPVVCHNGGVVNVTECLCPPGFSGASCETVDDADQCQNGSTAVGNRCICPPGLSGPRCDTYDNDTACQNGATAVGTECYCPSGYYGPRCEFYNASTTTVPATRPKSTPKAPVSTVQSTTATRSTTKSTTTTRSTSRTTPKPTTRSTTTSKSTKTTTTPVPTTTDPCQNQGVWTATGCSCPAYLEGDYCQFSSPTIEITPEAGSFVRMTARVTNRLFSEPMSRSSSTAYRVFADEFERTMDHIYQNVSDYHSTKVLDLRNGSVVVNYRVLLHPPPEATSTYSLEHKSQELLETLKSVAQPQNCSHTAKELCFSPSSSEVTLVEKQEVNYTEMCRKRVLAKFRPFYYPHQIGKNIFCVTNCTLNVPGTIDCNGGNCRVTENGPRCYCPGVPWYLTSGDRCETHISKLGLGLGVGLGLGLPLLILLLLCLVLSTCLARRKTHLGKDSDSSDGSSWLGSRSKSRATGIYHVNGRGSAPWEASNTPSAYKPNAEAASFSMPMQPSEEAADSL